MGFMLSVMLAVLPVTGQVESRRDVVLLIDWHPNGDYLAVVLDVNPAILSEGDQTVWIYASSGQPIILLTIPATERIRDIQWNQDGSRLAVVTVDVSAKLFLWDTTNPEQPVAISSSAIDPFAVTTIEWNNNLLAIDYALDDVQIWDTATNQLLHTF
ncbi:MAG: WD40 repeat domain-containing protein, partial [Chloroflexi bacterium]|nr:WD40 repeat domain-containing protein [Chloroflexota bacterium]